MEQPDELVVVRYPVLGDELVVGQCYEVDMSDCCVSGRFRAKFVERIYDGGDAPEPDPFLAELRFDNGVTLTTWMGATFTPYGVDATIDVT